jgi:transposase-like protein
MLALEEKFGIGIEELLRSLYVDQNMSITDIGKELGCTYVTIFKWLQRAGIRSRKIKFEV